MESFEFDVQPKIPQTSYELTDLLKKNFSMSDMIISTGINEENIIKFLSDNETDPIVFNYIKEYYDRYLINQDKVLVISDTHLGGTYGSYDMVKRVYEFAIKNNIKYIIHGGDFIEGYVGVNGRNKDTEAQVEELIKEYPRTNEVITYYILGNHDYLAMEDLYFHKEHPLFLVRDALNTIPNLSYIGILRSYLNFNNQHRMRLFHSDQYGFRYPHLEYDLDLVGHSHSYGINGNVLNLPALMIDYGANTKKFIVLELEDNAYGIHAYGLDNNNPKELEYKRVLYKNN